ncbi:GNAT family N-acetyltransferase [Clostridium perfringens]|uniref:GNAT family N-acetyltransferase n=1 Tax=Clostridium perfringens TaxID=1502 RepID=UPI002246A8E2|nr:GNAT family N-acetyltransferase [Clostridium perfringens]MCX0405349.1 hypothetical protein [Clostridium perfringens]
MKNIFNTRYERLSIVEPEYVRRLITTDVGEKLQDRIYNNLKELENSYPDFAGWYYNTVIPEIELKDGKREIILAISEVGEKKNFIITGIVILKKTNCEKKICTFRVHEEFRNRGIGTELFEQSFKYLDTREPVITISENNIDMFKSHIIQYKFKEYQILDGYYKSGIKEYVYNGVL